TVAAGTAISLSTLFSYSDPDAGDSVTGFAVQDRSTGGGHLFLNGVQQADNVVFGNTATGIPISQIGQWAFVAGPGGSVDSIGFSPIDSHQAFSNATATVTAQSTDSVQQGTATTTILSVGQTLAGTIDAEPMASDIPISLPDGAGGYVDKDWFKVTLDKGKLY